MTDDPNMYRDDVGEARRGPCPRYTVGGIDDFGPILRIEVLQFERLREDHELVYWRALYEDPRAPASPLFALDVALARSGDANEDQINFRRLVGPIRAGFCLVAGRDVSAEYDVGAEDIVGSAEDEPLGPSDVTFSPQLLSSNEACGGFIALAMVLGRSLPAGVTDKWKTNDRRVHLGKIRVSSNRGRIQRQSRRTDFREAGVNQTTSELADSVLEVLSRPVNKVDKGCEYTFITFKNIFRL